MIVDEAVLYSGSLAKYRAAFFKKSRSSSVRRSWARRRELALGFEQFRCCSVCRLDRLHPLVQAMGRHPRRAATRHAIAAFDDLTDRFFLKLRGKSLCSQAASYAQMIGGACLPG